MTGPGERGAASVFALLLVGVLTAAVAAALSLNAYLVGQRRVAAAADLAALAGAAELQQGRDGCAAADRLALDNGARMTSCEVDGTTILVAVEVEVESLLGPDLQIPGHARGGPVD